MNFLKRALYAVMKRSGYSLLLLLIFAVIANLVLAGFAIQNATEQAEIFARQKLGAQITFQFDRAKAMENAMAANSNNNERREFTLTAEPLTEDIGICQASCRFSPKYV